MAASAPTFLRSGAVLLVFSLAVAADPAPAQLLPWEVTVAEIEAGSLRHLSQRLDKQYLLYQLRLGDVLKTELNETVAQIDRVLEALERGSPSHSIPAAWTPALNRQVERVQGAWGPLRRLVMVGPYEQIRLLQETVPVKKRQSDPLGLRYFDDLTSVLVVEVEKLLETYHQECTQTGLEICMTARTSGYAAMLIERATKEAIYVFAEIDRDENRKRLRRSIEAYREVRRANDESPFFAAALDPARGVSAKAAAELLLSLREDWDALQVDFASLLAGDKKSSDLRRLLGVQVTLVEKVERLTAALVRFASLTYGT